MEFEEKILAELDEARKDGPTFGQSQFQLKQFVIGNDINPRSYRQILLELDIKLHDLKKCRIKYRKINAQLSLLESKLSKETNEHRRIVIECDIEDKLLDREKEQKLV